MFSRKQVQSRQFTVTHLIGACALFIIVLAATVAVTQRSQAAAQRLSFEDRVAAQRALEAVYYQHRIWPAGNPQPKPSLEAVLTEDALREGVKPLTLQAGDFPVTREVVNADAQTVTASFAVRRR